MLFRNLGQALAASAGPILVALAISFGVVFATGLNPQVLTVFAADPQQLALVIDQFPADDLLGMVFLLLVYAFVFGWICVAWHRFILLEEGPGPIPAVTGRPIWLYVGTTILLAVLLVLLAIPLGLVASLVGAPFVNPDTEPGRDIATMVISLTINTITSYLWFRFAVVLPAAAIGKPMTLGDGWTATGRAGGAIFGAVIILILLSFLASLTLSFMSGVNDWLSFGAAIFVQWVTLMMGASILTTIYGVTVERRALG